ncbi:conserved hypothetical protein [Tenacibaculum sediminilitoris]|uniref:hypothetical protein n=1 Tax=Tenacibaculum sediminilitoris TaxID=1820334 RepID=UPI0038936AA7
MIKKLIVDFFKKIETDEGIDSRNGKAIFFVNSLLEEKHGKFHYISIQKATRIHKKYVENYNEVSANVKDPFLKDVMAEYLGFKDFENYRKSFTIDSNIDEENNLIEGKEGESIGLLAIILKNKIPILIGSILMVSLFVIYKDTLLVNSNCIVWKKDHYKKVPCYYLNSISNATYHIDIDRFKKVTLTKDMEFFTNEKPNYWYGSNKKGKREFFTARGVHPETLKELKPITEHILKSEGFPLL